MLYDAPMARVQVSLRDRLGVDATSRLKTVNTIIEKLRREKMRLAEMQDIAGLRIVGRHPRHGYRAVHVIPEVDGFLVEIQVRTRLQDSWAQGMERLADQAGRADIEVVLLSASSRDALKRTHGRYFQDVRQLATDLESVLRR